MSYLQLAFRASGASRECKWDLVSTCGVGSGFPNGGHYTINGEKNTESKVESQML